MDINGSNRGMRTARWVVILWMHTILVSIILLCCTPGFSEEVYDYADVMLFSNTLSRVFIAVLSIFWVLIVITFIADGRRYLNWSWPKVLLACFVIMQIPVYAALYYWEKERELLKEKARGNANGHITNKGGEHWNAPDYQHRHDILAAAGMGLVIAFLLWANTTKLTPEQEEMAILHEKGASILSEIRTLKQEVEPRPGTNLGRMEEAARLLQNSVFDEDALIYRVCISETTNEREVSFDIRFVDESHNVMAIKYFESEDVDSKSGTLLAAEGLLGSSDIRQVGATSLSGHYRAKAGLREPEMFPIEDDMFGFYSLVLPEQVFEKITSGVGQIVLFGKEGEVLDRARPKEFGYGVHKED